GVCAAIPAIALAAAFGDWRQVVGIPEARPAQVLQSPVAEYASPPGAGQPFDAPPFSRSVEPASGADAFIPLKDLLAQIAGIAAQTPFVDAPIRAERHS